MVRTIPKTYLELSRKLRQQQTPWEWQLWYHLRGNRLAGFKFKRQVNIDNYIIDFYCAEKKLIIECDGGHHGEKEISEKDQQRQKNLESKGYSVLRFWNNEISDSLEEVLEKIREALELK